MRREFFYVALFISFGIPLTIGSAHAEEYFLHQTRVVDLGNYDQGVGVAVDADKNSYMAARLGDVGQQVNALLKYDPAGGIAWSQYGQYGGSQAKMEAVAVDALGNVYVTGSTFIGEGGMCLTASYDPAGTLRWSQTVPGGYSNGCRDIVVDAAGNVSVAGVYQPVYGASWAILLVKYDAMGNQLCSATTAWPLPTMTYAVAVDVDAAGNAYVLGHIGAPGSYGVFKYDSACGEVSGPGPDIALPQSAYIYSDLVVDTQGMIYVVGNDTSDIHLVKFDMNGNLNNAIAYDGGGYDTGDALALDDADNVYVAGQSGGYVVIKYDSLLNLLWSDRWGTGTSDRALAIDVDADQDIYVTGTSGGVSTDGTLEYNAVTLVYSQNPLPPGNKHKKK